MTRQFMKNTCKKILFVKFIMAACIAATPAVGGLPASSENGKPAWLSEASLGIKEGYDDNVFASGVDSKYLPSTYTVPAGSVAALKDRSSWVTTVSPKLAVDFAPLLDVPDVFKTLTLAYAPDFVIYHDQPSENYDAHKFITAIKAGQGAFKINADNTFTYVDGSTTGPTYPGALFNAYMASAVRERRKQIQDKSCVSLQYDWEDFFVRPTASLIYYDMMTTQLNVTGYQNYEDRYDVNGGADAGWKFAPNMALTLGYRYGSQYQQQFTFSPYSSSSEYQRVLFGFEGKPWKWLDIKFQAGPDFRDYPGNTATHITPLNDLHPVKYYGEGAVIATVTTNDSISFKYKQWQWVSSIGKVPYYDSTFDLSYHRRVTSKLGFDLGGKLLSSDYTTGNLPNCQRDDWDYLVTAGIGYAFNSHLSASLCYTLELGRNDYGGVVNPSPSTREYQRDMITLGALVKF
jgi:hypothetical protein